MKKFFLVTFVLIFFIAGITILRLPLSLVSPTVKELFPQVSYTSMEGTIWSGRINNLSFADEYLGSLNTSFNLRNLSFLVDERGLFLEGNINLLSTILNILCPWVCRRDIPQGTGIRCPRPPRHRRPRDQLRPKSRDRCSSTARHRAKRRSSNATSATHPPRPAG